MEHLELGEVIVKNLRVCCEMRQNLRREWMFLLPWIPYQQTFPPPASPQERHTHTHTNIGEGECSHSGMIFICHTFCFLLSTLQLKQIFGPSIYYKLFIHIYLLFRTYVLFICLFFCWLKAIRCRNNPQNQKDVTANWTGNHLLSVDTQEKVGNGCENDGEGSAGHIC